MSAPSPSAPPRDPSLGRVLAGRYRIVDLLGEGGMGRVYRAVHLAIGKDVAVKVLRPELGLTDEAVRQFEGEARAAGSLSHPACVTVTDLDREPDGTWFLVMELVGGRVLADALRDEGALPPARALWIADAILDAVGAAHARGIVHRDLKPENVMLVRDEDGEGVKLLDFGIARLATGRRDDDARGPSGGSVFGTLEYLAPEQALGEVVDGRADLYAVGVMLYEMLAGRRPFEGSTRGELIQAHLLREPPPLRQLAPGLPPALEAAVARALRKRRDERWPDAASLRAALAAVPLGTDGPSASPAPAALPGGAATERLAALPPRPAPPVLPAGTPAARRPAPPSLDRATAPLAPSSASAPPAPVERTTAPFAPATRSVAPAERAISPRDPPEASSRAAPSTDTPPAPSHDARPAMAARAARGPSRPARHGLFAAVAAAALAIGVVAFVTRVASREAPAPAAAQLERVRAALSAGDLATARAAAEQLAQRFPRDAGVYAALAHVLLSQADKERGLASYRAALRLDPRVGARPELLAHLRATFRDPVHGEAAFRLAEEIGRPALGVLRDAAASGESAVRRRAVAASTRIAGGAAPAPRGGR